MEYIDFNIVQTGKTLSSDKIIINKYDNKISRLFFNFDGTILGRLYFAMLNPITNKYCMKPILNSQVIITTEVSVYPGKWSALLVGVQDDYEIIDNNIDQSKVTFVSNPFNRIIVRDNFLSDSSIEPTVNPAIDEALESLRISQDRLENAAIKATESALLSSENAEKTAQDKVKIEAIVRSVEGIDEQVKLVETYKNDASSSAQQASTTLSSVNKQSEQVANMKQSIDSTYEQVTNLATKVSEDANTVSGIKSSVETLKNETQNFCKLAEDAKAVAELASTQASKDKTTIGEWKISIDEIKNQIVIDKAEMDKIKADVNTNKVSSENAAKQTTEDKNAVHLDRIAVETVKQNVEKLGSAVQEATQTGVQAVDQAKQTAVNAVETAKTEAVKAVQTEGTTQTGNVTAEGAKQVQAVQAAAQEIVADREQVKKNKADIAGIKEEMNNFSSAIINSATGESIVVEDSSGNKFKGLNAYGKSTQVTTTGAQLFDVQNVFSTEEKNGVTFVVEKDEIVINGTATASADLFSAKDFLLKLPAGEYTFSIQKNSSISLYLNINSNLYQTYNGVMTAQITPDSKITYFIVRVSPNVKFNNYRLKIMLNEGSTAKPWEPYTGGKPSPSVEYPQEITSSGDKGNIGVDVYGENLLNITDLESTNIRVDSKGDLLAVTSKTNSELIYENVVYKFSLNPGTYIFMCEEIEGTIVNRNNHVAEIKINKTNIGAGINNRSKRVVFTVDEKVNAEMCLYKYFTEAGKSYTIKGLRLTAVKELPFEPYKPVQSLAIPTPNGIRGLPVTYSNGNYTDTTRRRWICDEIDLERGKYIQRVEKTDLKDLKWSDDWNKNPSYYIEGTFLVYSPNLNCEPTGKAKPLSNKFRYVNNILRDPTTGMDTRQGGGRNIAFRVPVSIAENVEQWSEFVNNNDIEVIYTLETPIEHDLPPEVIEAYKQLRTNYPVTTILNDAGAGMKVEYAADTKNYTDNKIAESVKNQMQNLTNLLSLMPMETQAVMIENDVNRILESEVTK